MTRRRNPQQASKTFNDMYRDARTASRDAERRAARHRGCFEAFPGCNGHGCDHPKPVHVANDPSASSYHITWAARHLCNIEVFVALTRRNDLPEHVMATMFATPAAPIDERLEQSGSIGDRIEALTASTHMTGARLRQLCAWNSIDAHGAGVLLALLGADAAYILIAKQPHNRAVLDVVEATGDWNARVAAAFGRGTIVPSTPAKLRRNVAEVAARFGRNPGVPVVMAGIADGWNGTVDELISATKLILALDA